MDWQQHELTDGYETVRREDATPAQLFDLAHDMLDRLDALEWAFCCMTLVVLRHLDEISDPDDPAAYRETLVSLKAWLANYQRNVEKAERDRQFLDAPE